MPRLNKYYKLAEFFKSLQQGTITMTFDEVGNKAGFRLPDSAYFWRPWWANDLTHSQSVWLDYGYKTEVVDMQKRIVIFRKYN